MRYGTPYKGGKNKIAKLILEQLPEADCFVDLFAGGCAITHAAMLSGKYKTYIANDISTAPSMFKDAVDGKYADETRWISREDFFRLKDSDDYVKYCWSFGNDGRTYMYSKEIEPWKKAIHYARVLQDYSILKDMGIESNGSRADIEAHMEEYWAKYMHWRHGWGGQSFAESTKPPEFSELAEATEFRALKEATEFRALTDYPWRLQDRENSRKQCGVLRYTIQRNQPVRQRHRL